MLSIPDQVDSGFRTGAIVSPSKPGIRRAPLSPYEFEISERHGRARLLAVIYTLDPPVGMDFDEAAVRAIRAQWDPGFVPFHRKMVFRSTLGSEIICHNWGVARYSEHGVQSKLLLAAARPRSGYFSTLEHPTDIDGIFPFGVGMDDDGLPPPYERFDGPKVMEICRFTYGEALAKFKLREAEAAKEKETRIDDMLDEADQKFADVIPRTDWSTHTPPTKAKDRIQGDANASS